MTVNSSVGALDRQRHTPKAFLSQDVHLVPDSQSNSLQIILKFSFFTQTQKGHLPLGKKKKKKAKLVHTRLHICYCVHLLCFDFKMLVETVICSFLVAICIQGQQ